MGLAKKINSIRKQLMQRLTRNVGSTPTHESFTMIPELVTRVLIVRPNSRLGNMLLLSPLLQEISTVFPNAKIDLFVRNSLIPILYKNYAAVDRDIRLPKKPFKALFEYIGVWLSLRQKRYDLAINVDSHSSSGRLAVRFSNSRYKLYGDPASGQSKHMAKRPVEALRTYISGSGLPRHAHDIPTMDIQLTHEELTTGKKLLASVAGSTTPVIAIYTFATGSKMYSMDWWQDFYEKLKKAFPDYAIVEVLPYENVSQIQFEAPAYYSRDLRQLGAFIANTAVFITADCGIMHLAASVHTPTVGLFSVTSIKKYKPYNPGSRAFDTNKTAPDMIIASVKRFLGKIKPAA